MSTTKPYIAKLYAMGAPKEFNPDRNCIINRDEVASINIPFPVLRLAIDLIPNCRYTDDVLLPMGKDERNAEEVQCAKVMSRGCAVPVALRYTYGYSRILKRPQKIMLDRRFAKGFVKLLQCPKSVAALHAQAGNRNLFRLLPFWESCNGAAGDLYVADEFHYQYEPGSMLSKLNQLTAEPPKRKSKAEDNYFLS